jgi:hypothetical protein
MTKSKGKKAKKGSSKGSALPKKLGGVKVPKAVRQSTSLSTLFGSGLGREILADALIAAAGAAAAALTRTRPAKEAGHAVAETGAHAAAATGDAVQTAAGTVAHVVTEAARNFLPASLVSEDRPGEEPSRMRTFNRSAETSSSKRSRKRGE